GTTMFYGNADADEDGVPNGKEYVAGTNPNNASDCLRITYVAYSDDAEFHQSPMDCRPDPLLHDSISSWPRHEFSLGRFHRNGFGRQLCHLQHRAHKRLRVLSYPRLPSSGPVTSEFCSPLSDL